MAKGINPALPENIGGGGVPILGGKKPESPPAEPWDSKYCYKLIFPLYPAREFLFKSRQEDPGGDLHVTQTGVALPRSLYFSNTDRMIPVQRIDFVNLGFILEVIEKPAEFDRKWEEFFGKK